MNSNEGAPLTFNAGDILFRQGDAAAHVFIIEKGHVTITRRVFREEIVLETLGPGNIIGEIAFASGANYPVSAEAIEVVEVLAVPQPALPKVLGNAEILNKVVTKLATRLSHLHFQLGVLAMSSAEGRVMRQLRQEAELNGALNGGAYAPIPFDLPDVLCLEKGAVDAVLRELVRRGLIEIDGGGRFRVSDLTGFDRLLAYDELADRLDK